MFGSWLLSHAITWMNPWMHLHISPLISIGLVVLDSPWIGFRTLQFESIWTVQFVWAKSLHHVQSISICALAPSRDCRFGITISWWFTSCWSQQLAPPSSRQASTWWNVHLMPRAFWPATCQRALISTWTSYPCRWLPIQLQVCAWPRSASISSSVVTMILKRPKTSLSQKIKSSPE